MKKIFLLLNLFLLLFIQTPAQSDVVYVASIDREIDLGMAPYIRRVVDDANSAGASAIIFHINTFGGRVDAATQIKDAILSSKILTIAFVNNRAVSAGALISLSCKKIVMAPGSVIGAATVVDQSGEKLSEKYQAYMRSEMRSTAEKNGRPTDIAQAMVDERIVIKGLVDSTQLVSLTTDEALKYGIADTTAASIQGVLADFNLSGAKVINVGSNWAEEVVKFLNNPIVSSILIMIGFFGLFAEIKTPGWGVPGTVGIVALALFFGSSYILELASVVDIVLFVIGLVLIALEIFVVPGFGITGISGIILVIAALFLSLTPDLPYFSFDAVSRAVIQLSAALLFSLIGIFFAAKFLPKSTTFRKLILDEAEFAEKGFVSYPTAKELIGKIGVALTDLRPAGTAEFDDKRIDVVTDSEYINRGTRIKVLRVEGIKVVVRGIKEDQPV